MFCGRNKINCNNVIETLLKFFKEFAINRNWYLQVG